ncbi:leucine-rich repeat and immunoglobulin-like domain-containing nogo receptor-interacting protein 4 [Ambystoma mexicanum]|uniref:leucine-rich repeat and immunoglobulin-like domain-containing nogo receptor-interacting protein 4 n=1 Tax=Ambystoma mexicanum TaxID=8296 RepID=UPI0037E8A294
MAFGLMPCFPSGRPCWHPLLFLALEAILTSISGSCPSVCECSSQDSTVLCSHRHLTSVPGQIPPESQLLDLSKNRIKALNQGMFSHLKALKELDLSENVISKIEPGTFRHLQNLMTLRLKNNKLKLVPAGVFSGLPNLTFLDISDNDIVILLDHSFKDLFNLRNLEAGDNQLVFVSHRAFGSLHNLQQLTLEKCNLTSVPAHALSHLHHLVEFRFRRLNISIIHNYSFKRLNHLKVLEIDQWPFLDTLEPNSLFGVNLTALTLTRCNLSSVPYEALQHLIYLTHLDLSYNPISVIQSRRLSVLLRLQELHLSGGRLVSIASGALQGLVYFRLLNVSKNLLMTLEEEVFHTLETLEILRLDGNPLSCDCRILWLIYRRDMINFDGQQPACATPAPLEGMAFEDFPEEIPADYFTCQKPVIYDKLLKQLIADEGEKIFFTCKGEGNPPPTISWLSPQNDLLDVNTNGRIRVLADGTLEIYYARPKDSGRYLCIAHNAAGNDTLLAELEVISKFSDTFTSTPFLTVVSQPSRRAPDAALKPFTLNMWVMAVVLAMGFLPFLSAVIICFIFIFCLSLSRGNIKHNAQIEYVRRKPYPPIEELENEDNKFTMKLM